MGVCIYFRSESPVTADVERAVRAASSESSDEQPWLYCEPPHFLVPFDTDGLLGSSKLNLMPHPEEAAEAATLNPERHDFHELLYRLCDWSTRFGIAWKLDIEDEPIGTIRNGECDASVTDAINGLADVAGQLESDSFDAGPSFGLTDPADDSPERKPDDDRHDDPPILRLWPGPD